MKFKEKPNDLLDQEMDSLKLEIAQLKNKLLRSHLAHCKYDKHTLEEECPVCLEFKT